MYITLVDPDDLTSPLRAEWDSSTEGGKRFIQVIGHVPDCAERLLAYYTPLRLNNELGSKLSELIRLTIAETTRCPYCLASRHPAAIDAGLREEDVRHVTDPDTGDFSPGERAALRFAYKFGADHLAIRADDFAALHEHFSDRQIAELAMLCAQYLGMGRLVQVLHLDDPAPAFPPPAGRAGSRSDGLSVLEDQR